MFAPKVVKRLVPDGRAVEVFYRDSTGNEKSLKFLGDVDVDVGEHGLVITDFARRDACANSGIVFVAAPGQWHRYHVTEGR